MLREAKDTPAQLRVASLERYVVSGECAHARFGFRQPLRDAGNVQRCRRRMSVFGQGGLCRILRPGLNADGASSDHFKLTDGIQHRYRSVADLRNAAADQHGQTLILQGLLPKGQCEKLATLRLAILGHVRDPSDSRTIQGFGGPNPQSREAAPTRNLVATKPNFLPANQPNQAQRLRLPCLANEFRFRSSN